MTTLLALTLVLVKGNDWGWTSRVVLSLGVTSALTLIAFVWMEAHVSAPMVPLALFKDRQFNGAALATVLSGVFMVGLFVLMPRFFTKVLSKTELMAAPITAAKARRLVAANYMQVLKARSLQSAPVRIKAQIHQQVAQKVHSQVKHTNQRIRTAASAIKAKTKIELTAAFMRPYQVAWPFTLLLVMTTWCFAGRERKSGKPS